jgi:hypothetical protein
VWGGGDTEPGPWFVVHASDVGEAYTHKERCTEMDQYVRR